MISEIYHPVVIAIKSFDADSKLQPFPRFCCLILPRCGLSFSTEYEI